MAIKHKSYIRSAYVTLAAIAVLVLIPIKAYATAPSACSSTTDLRGDWWTAVQTAYSALSSGQRNMDWTASTSVGALYKPDSTSGHYVLFFEKTDDSAEPLLEPFATDKIYFDSNSKYAFRFLADITNSAVTFPTSGWPDGSSHRSDELITPIDCLVAVRNGTGSFGVGNVFPASTGSPSWPGSTFDSGVTAPTAPTLSGTALSHSNTLNWTAPTGATGYTLKRGTTTIYTGSATTYNDTGLTNGTAYAYTVTANNTGGTSDPSNTVTLTPSYAVGDITNRDIQLASIGLAGYIAIQLLKPFRWRGND